MEDMVLKVSLCTLDPSRMATEYLALIIAVKGRINGNVSFEQCQIYK